MKITDTYFYLLENPGQRQVGLCSEAVHFQTRAFRPAVYTRARQEDFGTFDLAYRDWLSFGRSEGLAYAPGKHTVLKIILKVKDEPELLERWIEHHAQIVGYDNLVVLDCGSVDEAHLSILDRYRRDVLVLDYRKYYDYIHTTNSNRGFFGLLAQNCRYLTILDADEFLVLYKDGSFSTSGICEYLSGSSEAVFAGSWINNAAPPEVTGDAINWEAPVAFSLSHESLTAGTVAGKAIVRSTHVFRINHLGHNLHVSEVAKEMTANSFGRFFVLHLKSLDPALARRRLLKHLKAKCVVPQTTSSLQEVEALLQTALAQAAVTGDVAAYIKQYLGASAARTVPPMHGTSRSMLLSGQQVEHLPELSQIVDAFDFRKLLEDRRRALLTGVHP